MNGLTLVFLTRKPWTMARANNSKFNRFQKQISFNNRILQRNHWLAINSFHTTENRIKNNHQQGAMGKRKTNTQRRN